MTLRIHQFFAAGSGLLALFICSAARAAPHTGDGFYLQLSTGFGAPQFSTTARDSFSHPALEFTDHRGGPSLNGSLFLGAPLAHGLAVGVGGIAAGVWNSAPDRTENGEHVMWEDNGGPYVQTLTAAGPFVDYYPSSRYGWHVQALVGYATLGSGDMSATAPSGFALMAGVGQDWWTSERWSVGVLARLLYASTRLSATPYSDGLGGVPSEHDTLISPSLEVSFTFH